MCKKSDIHRKVRAVCNLAGHIPEHRAQQFSRTCNVLIDDRASPLNKLQSAMVLAATLSR